MSLLDGLQEKHQQRQKLQQARQSVSDEQLVGATIQVSVHWLLLRLQHSYFVSFSHLSRYKGCALCQEVLSMKGYKYSPAALVISSAASNCAICCVSSTRDFCTLDISCCWWASDVSRWAFWRKEYDEKGQLASWHHWHDDVHYQRRWSRRHACIRHTHTSCCNMMTKVSCAFALISNSLIFCVTILSLAA